MKIRALKYRLYPTEEQKEFLSGVFDAARFTYNAAIDVYGQHYTSARNGDRERDKEELFLSAAQISKQLTELTGEPDYEWVKKKGISRVNSLMIKDQAVLAWMKYWVDKKKGIVAERQAAYLERKRRGGGKININHMRNIGKPKFKSRHDRQSFSLDRGFKVDIGQGLLYLPKSKAPFKFNIKENDKIFRTLEPGLYVKKQSRAEINRLTVERLNSGHYYISLMYDFEPEEVTPKVLDTLHLDIGVRHMVVSSDGEVIDGPKAMQSHIRKLRKLQRKASRQWRTNGGVRSENWKKTNAKIAKLHERIKNIRQAALHEATHDLIQKAYERYAVEDISIKEMLYTPMPEQQGQGFKRNNRKLQAFFNMLLSDASLAEFVRQLEYKAGWAGLEVVKTDKGAPTNKECSNCGHENDVKPSDFTYICKGCGTTHQKNVNSLEVIKKYISVL